MFFPCFLIHVHQEKLVPEKMDRFFKGCSPKVQDNGSFQSFSQRIGLRENQRSQDFPRFFHRFSHQTSSNIGCSSKMSTNPSWHFARPEIWSLAEMLVCVVASRRNLGGSSSCWSSYQLYGNCVGIFHHKIDQVYR